VYQRSFLPDTGQPATALVDLVVRSRELPDRWWVRASVRNLLGSDYREVPRDRVFLLDREGGSNTLPTQPRLFLLEVGKEF
jgi:hypothetical protein